MSRRWLSGIVLASACTLIVVGCGDDKKNEAGKTAAVVDQAKKVRSSDAVKRTLKYDLTPSLATIKAIRAAGGNPAMFNAHVVNYEVDGKTVPFIEISQRAAGDTSVADAPAYTIELNDKPADLMYEATTTLPTQFGTQVNSNLPVGKVSQIGNHSFDLCVNDYAAKCKFVVENGNLLIVSWLQ